MENGWIISRKIRIREVDPPIHQTYTMAELDKLTKKPSTDDFVEYRNWVIIKYICATGNRVGDRLYLEQPAVHHEARITNKLSIGTDAGGFFEWIMVDTGLALKWRG